MMKKIITIKITQITMAALFMLAISCDDITPTPQFAESTADFSVTPSANAVGITAKDSLSDAISFSWTDPQYATGLEKSKFTIVAGPTGKNFEKFVSKDFSGVLTGSLLGKEVNAMALEMGGVIGQPISLDVKVVASQANNNEQKNSNVMQISVTPYGDLALKPSTTSVITGIATSSQVGLTLTWTTAFTGYSGVKIYVLQYAKGGTSFASPINIDVTGVSKSFKQLELNKMALAFGVPAGGTGPIDFRIKTTNESGTVLYSNIATVSITTYIAFNSMGIVGDATQGGWDIDTDMYRPDATKPTEWTVTAYLTAGKSVKFRADDKWDDSWGAASFPAGTGTAGGPNIPVNASGYYQVKFDVATGAYSLTPVTTTVYSSISLVGAQSGWTSDIADLTNDPSNNQVWTGIVTLAAGELKFRANHDWTTNWGISPGIPATTLSGYGKGGGDNMNISVAGDYFVYINVATNEYFFGKADRNNPYADVGIVGNATAGGWSTDTNLIRNPLNSYKWSGTFTLTDGEAKFRADNDWTVNWGGATFPGGTGTNNGPNIPAQAGTYFITLNTATGEYYFLK
jgi:hypothetical protein